MSALEDNVTPSVLTDEAIARLETDVGRKLEVYRWNTAAGPDAIRHFAFGIGDDNPLWWDAERRSRASGRGMCAPPTFYYTVASLGSWPDTTVARSGNIPSDASMLWAGDRWVWHAHVEIGEEIAAEREITDVARVSGSYAKRSLSMTERMAFLGRGGRLLAELFRTTRVFDSGGEAPPSRYAEISEPRYDEEQLAAIAAQYVEESRRRRGATPRPAASVRVGDTIDPLVKGPLTKTSQIAWMMGWGMPMCPTDRMLAEFLERNPGLEVVHPDTGIPDTFAAVHYSGDIARQRGLARGFDFGAQRISWIAHMLTDWCGDEGWLAELDVKLRRPNLIGDTTWLSGEVTTVEHTPYGGRVHCNVSAANQRDETTATGTAVVALP